MTLDEMLTRVKDISREVVESGEQHSPIVVFEGREEGAALIELPDSRAKDHFARALISFLRLVGAQRYVFVCEAWIAAGKAAEQAVKSGHILDLPPDDRDEAISIIAVEQDGRVLMCHAVIFNKPEGRRLGEWSESGALDKLSGRMLVTKW